MSERASPDGDSFIQRHGYLSWLGLTLESYEEGGAILSIPARDELRNPGAAAPAPIHGGVLATLVDTSSAFALRTTFDDPEAAGLTTTNLDVSYLRPATGDLRAIADVVRAGRSMGVVDVEVESQTPDGPKLVVVGRTNYRLFREGS